MTNKALVILNEQHTLLTEQSELLDTRFPQGWEIFPVPAEGWNLEEQKEIANDWPDCITVFASPVPVLLARLAFAAGCWSKETEINTQPDTCQCPATFVFHNDNRDKKELPNGKIIFTVAKTGWQIV